MCGTTVLQCQAFSPFLNTLKEDRKNFSARRSVVMKTISITESRKSVPDQIQKYLRKNSDGLVAATSAFMHSTIGLDEFVFGIGAAKPDEKLK